MADDFTFYQGDDKIPYFVIMDGNDPVDLSGWSAATWVASPMTSTTPIITKHKSDMTLAVDPDDADATVKNCIFVPIVPEDTQDMVDVGQFRHELRITLGGYEVVLYPAVGTTATFSVVASLTWDPTENPPAPRLVRMPWTPPVRIETPEIEQETLPQLKRIPKLVESTPNSIKSLNERRRLARLEEQL